MVTLRSVWPIVVRLLCRCFSMSGFTVKDVKLIGGGHRVPPAGLPIEQVLGEYSLSFLRRDVALFVSTGARDSF